MYKKLWGWVFTSFTEIKLIYKIQHFSVHWIWKFLAYYALKNTCGSFPILRRVKRQRNLIRRRRTLWPGEWAVLLPPPVPRCRCSQKGSLRLQSLEGEAPRQPDPVLVRGLAGTPDLPCIPERPHTKGNTQLPRLKWRRKRRRSFVLSQKRLGETRA